MGFEKHTNKSIRAAGGAKEIFIELPFASKKVIDAIYQQQPWSRVAGGLLNLAESLYSAPPGTK
jgi:hypothetical protein